MSSDKKCQTKPSMKDLSLEQCFVELEQVVKELEAEHITLEDSFLVYKRGMELLKNSNMLIDNIEKKVLKLCEDGSLEQF